MERKRTTSAAELCHDLPPEFATYLSYVRDLPDEALPDYRRLRTMFGSLFRRYKYKHDHVYDWTILKYLEEKKEYLRVIGGPVNVRKSIIAMIRKIFAFLWADDASIHISAGLDAVFILEDNLLSRD